eukprot:PhM_4_TR9554/c0_g1_i1/m.15430
MSDNNHNNDELCLRQEIEDYLDMERQCTPIIEVETQRQTTEKAYESDSSSDSDTGEHDMKEETTVTNTNVTTTPTGLDGNDEENTMPRSFSCLSTGASAEMYQVSRITNRKKRHGVVFYYVEWKFYPYPTWESSDVLREEGQGLIVNAFESEWQRTHKDTPSQKLMPKKPSKTEAMMRMSYHGEVPLPGPLCWTRWVARTVEKVNTSTRYYVSKIECIVKRHLLDRYFAAYSEAADVRLAYHGTRGENISCIIENGLHVPGTNGVVVQNGSAYGVGIYLAESPNISLSYTRGCGRLIVCAVILGDKHKTTTLKSDSIIVVNNPAQVLPIYLVHINQMSHALIQSMDYHAKIGCSLDVVQEFRHSKRWKETVDWMTLASKNFGY